MSDDLLSQATTPLDAAIGLTAVELHADRVVLRLDPLPAAAGDLEPRATLHGGALATCVDTAGWYAVEHTSPGNWVAVDLRCDFLRPAAAVPHRVVGRCLVAGRSLATADVEISTWEEPERIIAVGRARYMRLHA